MDIQRSIIFLTEAAKPTFNPIFFLMLACIFMSAFFSMSETAFSSVSLVKLKSLVEDRKHGARKALDLAENFDKTVTTLLIGNNIVNTTLAVVSVKFFADLIIFNAWLDLASTLIITVVLLIFGEILPKTAGKNNPEGIACRVAFIIYMLSLILFPFVFIFRGIQKLISKKDEEKKTLDEEELKILIDEMEESDEIEDDEAELIKKVFDLKERNVEDIMVPRIKMVALDYSSTLTEVKELLYNTNYSRIPVYKSDKDHIVGVLYERDFFPALAKNQNLGWKKLIRPVNFVSSQMKADDLIVEFQKNKAHLAIVSGEYGEVLGLVTMEDALEELVGEIYDEHDVAGEDDLFFEELGDNTYLVDAEMYVEDFFERLNVGDVPEDVPAKMSGWLFAKCESIPKVGFEMNYVASYTMIDEETEDYEDYYKNLSISIAEVEDRRITKIKVIVRDLDEEEIEQLEKETSE